MGSGPTPRFLKQSEHTPQSGKGESLTFMQNLNRNRDQKDYAQLLEVRGKMWKKKGGETAAQRITRHVAAGG